MDPELKQYLDRMFLALTDQIGRLEQRMEARMDALERRGAAMHVEMTEKFIAVDARFRTLELRMEQFEARVLGRLDGVDHRLEAVELALVGVQTRTASVEQRLDALEDHLLATNVRLDDLAEELRQRFRVVNDRLTELAA
jgi:hypothetical protein